MTPSRHTRPAGFAGAVALALTVVSLSVPLFLAGCGGGDIGPDTVIATVGDRDVTAAYYELKLGKVDLEDLPVDDLGQPVDTSTLEGKKAFLDVIVNKELMAAKAEQLGFGASENVKNITRAVSEVEGSTLMHEELIEGPAADVTDQEIEEYYAKVGEQRRFRFIICNFEEDALAAREQVLAGKDWTEVADEFNDGAKGPAGDYTVEVTFGRVADDFEDAIFALEEGQVSEPIFNLYGYWIMRLEKMRKLDAPPLDDNYRERIRMTLKGRNINLMRKKFIEESRERHEFKMDDDALWIIFQGLPDEEPYLDPETQKPIPKAELSPLDVDRKDLDRFFFSLRADLAEEPEVWTIGDFKNLYDDMSTFQRPKRSQALGGVRNKIVADMVDRPLLAAEARERGYLEDSRVLAKARERSEQAMVTRLHDEVVTYDQFVSKEELDAFWNEHKDEYEEPEKRAGKILYCREQDQAAAAVAEARAGAEWAAILDAYEVNQNNKDAGGELAPISSTATGPVRDVLFELAEGQVSDPVAVENGWVVVKLEEITPQRMRELAEMHEQVSERIRRLRKDQALKDFLAEWREEFPVTIYEGKLSSLPSWDDLHAE